MDPKRSVRQQVSLFVGDVTSPGDWQIPTGESVPLGTSRDLSMTGVFVETSARPDIDSLLEIVFMWGEDSFRSKARVVRHTDEGIGLRFIDPDMAFQHMVREVTE